MIYFTSDPHIDHNLVATKRGFATADEHSAAFEDAWRGRVRADDVVWVLGDLTLRNPMNVLPFFNSLPGRKRLILGNHDAGHPMQRDAHKYFASYAAVFELVAASARIKLEGREVLLSHFPYEADRDDSGRHMQWRLPDHGVPLVHGHLHVKERFSRSLAGTPQLHVGHDAWGAPVSSVTLRDLLLAGE